MTKDQAIKWAGNARALAERLQISESAVSQWGDVPELQQLRLHLMSAGRLPIDQKYQVTFAHLAREL